MKYGDGVEWLSEGKKKRMIEKNGEEGKEKDRNWQQKTEKK